jgi:PSP1 C-terminal conserved region
MPYSKQGHRRGTSSNFGSAGSFDLPQEPAVDQSPRHRSRDRPPLSQSYLEMYNSTTAFEPQQHAFGVIGSDARRRRAASHDVFPLPPPPDHIPLPPPPDHFKFANLNQSQHSGFASMERPRHIRSVSQPGPPGLYGVDPQANYRPAIRSSSFYEPTPPTQTSRSASSSPNLGQYYGSSCPPNDQREALDVYSAASYSGSVDSYASHTPGTVSPVGHHSPQTVHYGAYPMRYTSHEHDELVGENIEVPDQHEDLPYYGGLQNLRGHGHSLSLDASTLYGAAAARKNIYAVKFKRSQRNFVLGSRINRELKIGTYVKVEADRGEDLGIVVGRPDKSYIREAPKRILRLATHDEVSLLGLKREEEEELLKVCRQKALQRGLPMNVVDAEYQFDRHKLTFFFEAAGRVDFRELVRDLFSMYKTRIWMQQLDKSTSMFAQAMVAPVMDGPLDFGNPIIAPLSEFVDSIYPNAQP